MLDFERKIDLSCSVFYGKLILSTFGPGNRIPSLTNDEKGTLQERDLRDRNNWERLRQ